jgi:gas vesicle protein
MSDFDRTDRNAYITLGLLVGAAAGWMAGMLTAPKSGSQMREELKLRATEAKGKAQEHLRSSQAKVKQKLNQKLEQSKDMVDEAANLAQDTVDKAAGRSRGAIEKARTNANPRL